MPTSEAQKRASTKHNRSMESITIRPSKETGALIRDAANAAGVPLQRYIVRACLERMVRDGVILDSDLESLQ